MGSDGPPLVQWRLPPEGKDDRGRDGFILLAGLGLLLLLASGAGWRLARGPVV